ncbi:HRDC domain-containing protein [Streptosporangium lutulentum]
MPAYVIFHDATLREIAAELPSSLDELSKVSGVGENKLAKYGQEILDALSAQLQPTGTEPPSGQTD